MRRDWPVKQAIVDLPIRLERNSKRISGNSLNLLWAQNKDHGSVVQRYMFTVQRMLIYQNAVFLPGHAVSSIQAI